MKMADSIGAAGVLAVASPAAAEPITLAAPDGRASVTVDDTGADGPTWRATWRGRAVLAPSRLGFQLEMGDRIGPAMRIVAVRRSEGADRYTLSGSRSSVNDSYRMAEIDMAEPGASGRHFTLQVRAYDDGVAMRYRIATQPGMTQLRIQGELTEFAFPAATIVLASMSAISAAAMRASSIPSTPR
jgi:alpha-glucosidase